MSPFPFQRERLCKLKPTPSSVAEFCFSSSKETSASDQASTVNSPVLFVSLGPSSVSRVASTRVSERCRTRIDIVAKDLAPPESYAYLRLKRFISTSNRFARAHERILPSHIPRAAEKRIFLKCSKNEPGEGEQWATNRRIAFRRNAERRRGSGGRRWFAKLLCRRNTFPTRSGD